MNLGQSLGKKFVGSDIVVDTLPDYKIMSIYIEEESHHLYILQRKIRQGEVKTYWDIPELRGFTLFKKGRFIVVES
ncbi:MAG: hypothetical protein AAF915_06290 [Cyanobacteria bacterium P01_D01_bin.50]